MTAASRRCSAPQRDRKKQAVVANGRFAATNWTMLRRLPLSPASSNAGSRPGGRTRSGSIWRIGHGVVGDPVYGRPLRSGQMPDAPARDFLPKCGASRGRRFMPPASALRIR